MELNEYLTYLMEWTAQKVKESNSKGVILGLSGGIDSSLLACLVKKSFKKNHLVLIMPIKSNTLDEKYANELIKLKKINGITINLNKIYQEFINTTNISNAKENSLILGNTMARLRMITLYAFAQKNKYLVLGTDNACEWYTGYFTKYGDGGVDLLPMIHLLKKEIRASSKIMGVPDNIINRDPTAGLWNNQTDEDELGFSYDILDDFLSNKEVSQNHIHQIEKIHNLSEHKRKSIPIPNPRIF